MFVCLFLQMVQKKGFEQAAGEFFARFAEGFRAKHRADINVLETVHDVSRLQDPEVAKYLLNKFYIKISRMGFNLLKF